MLAHLTTHAPALHAALLAATSTKKTSSGLSILPFLLLILVAGYFLWMRPKQRARLQQQQQAQQRPLEIGDEVATSAGIVGVVRSLEDDRVRLEIAPGMVISVLRTSVGRSLGRAESSDWSASPSGDGLASVLAPGGSRDDDRGAWKGDDLADHDLADHDLTEHDLTDEETEDGAGSEETERAPGWSLTSDDVEAEPEVAVPAGRSRPARSSARARRSGGPAAAGGRP